MSDNDRLGWIKFILNWLSGEYMAGDIEVMDHVHEAARKWEEYDKIFPSGVTKPLALYRVITVPIEYADIKKFHIDQPAPGPVGSWTSTKIGLDTVAGVARELAEDDEELYSKTARVAIGAIIQPENIIATYESLRDAFLSLVHDFEYEEAEQEVDWNGGKYAQVTHPAYLGYQDDSFYEDLSEYIALFNDMPGGPYRQSEHIVRTTPVEANLIYVYRKGLEHHRKGHDDPHNY